MSEEHKSTTPKKPVSTLALADVPVGQKIWADVIIPAGDLHRPAGRLSTTMDKIFKNKAVRKMMIVLQNNGDHLICVYTSTFGSSMTLPDMIVEPKHWYPITPATGSFDPLPVGTEDSSDPQWVCLSTVFKLTQDPVPVLTTQYPLATVKLISAAAGLTKK
ncbi:hypothetical protein B0H34DRAFT_714655 [Crassisporium funariophilum]|nr:hypothetical protein B0H34DRAFT_714655 [Crassisporium funariophilum]